MKTGGFFSNLALKYRKFMYGRYGHDNLNRFVSFFSLFLCVLSFFIKTIVISVALLILLALLIFRSFSKDHARRRHENQVFLQVSRPVKNYFKYWFTRIKLRKSHYVFSCTGCGAVLRIPKSAQPGKVEMKCPKCGAKFQKRLTSGVK